MNESNAKVWPVHVLQSMEASGLEMKLKHKLRKSAGADDGGEQHQPAQLERHQHKRRKLEQQQPQGGKVRREVGLAGLHAWPAWASAAD